MKSYSLFLFLWVYSTAFAQNPDEVISLPGLSEPISFRHYSGYLTVSRGHQFHYWFIESENDPVNDPLVLWLNGGPGCSSLYGLFREIGPFKVLPDGQTVTLNPNSWTKAANILFLESPAGVGFSYAPDGDLNNNDDIVSADNLLALEQFFLRYPEFSAHDFYIFGESYGGIYIPTLSYRIVNESAGFNFKGFGIGNGMSDYDMNDDSYLYFSYGHGLIDDFQIEDIRAKCCVPGDVAVFCNYHDLANTACQAAVVEANLQVQLDGTNVYSLYLPCVDRSMLKAEFSNLFWELGIGSKIAENILAKRDKYQDTRIDPPCTNSVEVATYLNTDEVRDALHISPEARGWTTCSDVVNVLYRRTYRNMKPHYDYLLAQPNLRAILYNGNTDMACNYLGDQWFTNNLLLPIVSERRPWTFDGYTVGHVKEYTNLNYVTVLGSGHMVPEEKPQIGYKLFSYFLQNKPLD